MLLNFLVFYIQCHFVCFRCWDKTLLHIKITKKINCIITKGDLFILFY